MKLLFATILLSSFLGLGVFGVFAMHIGMQNYHGGCIAATAQRVGCVMQNNLVDFVNFHLSIFKNFSTATFSDIGVLFIGLFLLAFGIQWGTYRWIFGLFKQTRYTSEQSIFFTQLSYHKLLSWLILHENSPSVV